jgi:hypothetical protein
LSVDFKSLASIAADLVAKLKALRPTANAESYY